MGSPAGVFVWTAVPSPGAATIAFQPTRPGKVSSFSETFSGPSTTALRVSSRRVVLSPPAPLGKVSCGEPAGRSATRRPSTVRTRPRSTSASFRRSTSARPSPRSCTVGISAWSRTYRTSTRSAEIETVERWLTEKLPSGWASAGAAPPSSARTTAMRVTSPTRRVDPEIGGKVQRLTIAPPGGPEGTRATGPPPPSPLPSDTAPPRRHGRRGAPPRRRGAGTADPPSRFAAPAVPSRGRRADVPRACKPIPARRRSECSAQPATRAARA